MLQELGIALDGHGNVKGSTEDPNAYHTSIPGIFATGDMRRGQSLGVWAIREDHQCTEDHQYTRAVDE